MDTRRRGHGSPLWLRLVALVVVPIVAVTVLGIQRIESEQREAAAASLLVDDVEHRSAVAAVLVAAEVERTALVGLARLDEIGLRRERIADLTGVDFESVYERNVDELDLAFASLTDEHGADTMPDGGRLSARLDVIGEQLAVQRALSQDGRAVVDDVDRTYAELDDVLETALVSTSHGSERSIALDRQRSQLDALGAVILSAGEVTRVLIDELLEEDPDRVQFARAEARHRAFVESFRSMLDPDQRASFGQIDAARAPSADDLRLGDEPDGMPTTPEQIRLAAANLLGQLDYIDELGDDVTGFMEQTALAVRSQAAEATAEATRTRALTWLLVALTLMLVGLVLWSTLTPIRRLTRRADEVSEGRLASEPLPVTGPRDVRRLTTTMNEMEAALGRVHDRITRLGEGDLTDTDDDPIPGSIGVALRNSVHHLASVTSQLHRSEALSTAIIDQADDAIWTVDDTGTILTANAASARLTGRTIDDQAGRTIDELLSDTDGQAVVLTHDVPTTTVLVARSVIDAGDDRVTAVIAHDISERRRFEEQLAYQAMHDELTGLPNRFALLEHVERLRTDHPGEVAVLYLDLDGFKSVNDVQGHAVGDRVLAEVAGKLAGTVRADDFVGRLGGDEFVVVTHRFSTTDGVLALADRLVREVELPHEDGGQFFSLSVSVGVAVPPPHTEALVMISQADTAVYQAKRQGRGRVVLFDREMQRQLDAATELESAVRTAVANDELIMHLQPVFDLATGEVRGGEALVRWMRPGHGLVPPNEFIPVAERSEVIVGIETWVLTQACERLVVWRERDPACTHRIAVNISGRHLAEGDLVGDVSEILDATGADPTMLELELTETHLLEDVGRATSALDQLRSMGITIAVDDFGTGYSSMTYLRDLPVDVLKIDRTFVARATEHGYDSTVVEAVLAIARILDLSVVAEGVETTEQLDFVRDRGCDAAQGFLMARPMPIDEAEAVIFGTTDVGAGRAPLDP